MGTRIGHARHEGTQGTQTRRARKARRARRHVGHAGHSKARKARRARDLNESDHEPCVSGIYGAKYLNDHIGISLDSNFDRHTIIDFVQSCLGK